MSEPAPYDGDTRTPGSAALVAFLFVFAAAAIALAALIFTLVTDTHPAAATPSGEEQSRGNSTPAEAEVGTNTPSPVIPVVPSRPDRHDRHVRSAPSGMPPTSSPNSHTTPLLEPAEAWGVYIRIPGDRLLRAPQFGEWQLTRFV